MNKLQAQKLIKDTFENTFDKGRFSGFVKNLLNHIEVATFTYKGNYIPDGYRQYIKTLERIGKYNDGEQKLDILIITLQKMNSLERARTMQRNFIAWYLNGSRGGKMKDAALVAFVSPDQADWRFSLVKMDYKYELPASQADASRNAGKAGTGKVKVKEEFTPARRWSFLVGVNEKSHTAQSRLVKILADDEHAPTLAQLEEAFNIETVTKEFFLKYRELFLRTKESLDKVVKNDPKVESDFNAKGVDTVNFAKKLLGQIVFLYFLQKKGWFGVGRDDDWGTGSRQFLRELFKGTHGSYQNFFNDILEPLFYEALRIDRSHDDDYYSRYNCKIPFLNGGLFDPIGNYDWVHTDIQLPKDLFSNNRKTNEGDIGDGILDVFDRYNFTVREDEPLEREVAIDPELLGKAYEKFNAIRPDNFGEFTKALKSGKKGEENKFNKKYGVYYTPREIVHYMCKQSLINYLVACAAKAKLKTSISKKDIEDLIEVGEMITEHEATALVKEQNIRKGIQQTTEYTAYLSDGICNNAKHIDNWLADITVCDPAAGSGAFPVGMMNEIVRARNVLSLFLKEDERSDYEFKRRCIEHSLYGVDIDPGAVEIAKLRLWLSLVVDEQDIKSIKPLPNLDYKIVCGNSLLGKENNLFNNQAFDELEKLKPLLFSETNPNKKKEYKNQIDELISRITHGHTDLDFEVYFSEVFHGKGGFDVVIANPPYFLYQGHHKDELTSIKVSPLYEICRGGKLNAYKLFLAKSSTLAKDNGIIVLIFQNSFLADNSAINIRKHYLENHRILRIDSFPERDDYKKRVFESVKMSVCILTSIHEKKTDYRFELIVWDSKHMLSSWKTEYYKSSIKQFSEKTWQIPYLREYEKDLFEKLFSKPKDHVKCYEGEINMSIHKHLLNTDNKNPPVINGAAVQRYIITQQMSQDILEYLDETCYLSENSGKKSNHHNLDRVVMQGITGVDDKIRIIMAIAPKGSYCANSCNYILPSTKISNEVLVGLFNSTLANWMFKKTSTNSNVNCYEIEAIPIPSVLPQYRDSFEYIVKQILDITKRDDYFQNPQNQAKVEELECEIDQLVYNLYDLTEKEIRLVEDGRR